MKSQYIEFSVQLNERRLYMSEKIEFENLMAEMARANISLPALAKLIGMGLSTIYNKKTGVQDWTLANMIAIQDVLQERTGLDLPLDYLFKSKKGGNE